MCSRIMCMKEGKISVDQLRKQIVYQATVKLFDRKEIK